MRSINRRAFLKQTGAAAGLGWAESLAAVQRRGVSIVIPSDDLVASSGPARWAAGELEQALAARGISARILPSLESAPAGDLALLAAGAGTPAAREILRSAHASLPEVSEALVLAPGKTRGKPVLLACGGDARGVVYALLELAERARYATDPRAALELRGPLVERPANVIRSIARCFQSDIEDKPWFWDRAMWGAYLSMLAANRFNRFSLTLGLGYNFPRNVRDVYFYFAYPFLVSVHNVRVAGLPDAERERNLETLRFIGQEAVKRGLQFQLGLWTHAYRWVDSPHANYTIEGLTPENHVAYCRDALEELLRACPAISGVTFRVHGESGVPEGSYSFWQTVFDGIVRCGRRVEIDMHAKGMDQKMIDVALATGMPVNISPKYWAEHMGLPYHQASIRELERAARDQGEGPFTLSSGSRRFLRYGYGDLLKEDRPYGILHRIWPGTQRVLLWGDPAMAAGYGRHSSFCGSLGVELCEPLSFKGRIGSGVPGGRCAYSDTSLNPRHDWEKYLYTYTVWGRLIYNPEADPETWRRRLRQEFGPGAQPAEAALAHASRILPLVTTTHGVSGSNNTYWPEVYTNMPIVDPERPHPYRDTPNPRRFGAVSPFDPQLFSRVDDFARELLEGRRSGKHSPVEVAQWLEDCATEAAKHLQEAASHAAASRSPEFRRWAVDTSIQSGLGRFYAGKLRSALLWALYERSDDPAALEEALKIYRAARSAWAELAERARGVYAGDITYGFSPHLRGHWLDRLPAIDLDIADMARRLEKAQEKGTTPADRERVRRAIREVLARPSHPSVACGHTPRLRFRPGEPLPIELSAEGTKELSIRLHYRHVNQAEVWREEPIEGRENRFRAVILGDYTLSPYPVQYYFELREGQAAWLYPGLEPTLANQPYFVVRRA